MDKVKVRALQALIGESRDRLYRVALAWCGDEMLADDLVQEAMTAGVVNIHQLKDEGRLFVWLYSILNNCWCRYLRKVKPQVELDEQLACENEDPVQSCHELEIVGKVRCAVATLPKNQSQVISLVDLEGFSYCEVAEVLEIPVGTVMSRLHRARKNLLDRLNSPVPGRVEPDRGTKKDFRIVK